MPGQFLTKAEREQLSSFPTHPTEDNIITFFTLSTQELTIVKKRNGELNRLIFGKRSGGGQAARGVDSAEELSLGSRQGEELPLLEARIASVINSKTFRF